MTITPARIYQPMTITPARIGLVGDIHGRAQLAIAAVEKFARLGITDVHFLGDFGVVWIGINRSTMDELEAAAVRHGSRMLVTGGNHEGYDQWDRIDADDDGIRWVRPHIGLLPRGWRARTAAGTVLASLGGANSIDRYAREPRRGWWPQESITDDDLAALGADPVDVLLAHDAPQTVALTQRLAATAGFWDKQGLAWSEQGQAMFHRGVRQVKPQLVVSGHYHFHLDVIEQMRDADGELFELRSVILREDGKPPHLAVLDVDARELEFLR